MKTDVCIRTLCLLSCPIYNLTAPQIYLVVDKVLRL